MSELEARKYTSIRNLREEIRQDMRDYQLLCSDDNNGNYYFPLLKGLCEHHCWFYDYLKQRIKDNLIKLKELMEDKND